MDGRQRFKTNAAKSMQNVGDAPAAEVGGPFKKFVPLGGAGGLGSGPGPRTHRSFGTNIHGSYQTQESNASKVSSK